MTSIFTSDYQQLLKRIESSPTTAEKGIKTTDSSGKDFARVLADIENPQSNQTSSSDLAKSPTNVPSSTPMLSNIKEEGDIYARARLGNYAPSVTPGQETNVKEQSISVKGLPPSPALPLPVTIPEAPQIISAKRLNPAQIDTQSVQGPATTVDGIKDIITTAGEYHGIDPSLSLAVAQAESSFRPDAVSSDGHFSKGIFQLLDSTGKEMMEMTNTGEEYDPFSPGMNSFLGVGYLRRLHDMFSEPTKLSSRTSTIAAKDANELEKFAVAAFNAGQGRVARAQAEALAQGKDPAVFSSVESLLPTSTREYVSRVQESRAGFASEIDLALKS